MDKDASEIIDTLNVILTKMATRDDIAELRTEMATKREVTELREEMRAGFFDLRSELKVRQRLDELVAAVRNISGFAKEIDHLIERVSAI